MLFQCYFNVIFNEEIMKFTLGFVAGVVVSLWTLAIYLGVSTTTPKNDLAYLCDFPVEQGVIATVHYDTDWAACVRAVRSNDS